MLPWLSLTRMSVGAGRECPVDRGVRLADHQLDGRRVAGVARAGRVRVVDARDALHVDADVDPHRCLLAGRFAPGGRSRRGRRRTARPSRSARGPSSRRSRSGRRRTPRPGAARRRRPRSTASPSGTSPVRWTIASRSTPNRAAISSAIVSEDPQRPSTRAPRTRATRRVRPAWRAASASWPGAGVPGRRRASARGTRRPRRPRGSRARRRARPGWPASNGASRSSRIRIGRVLGRRPPETGGIIATSSPSASGVVGVGVVAVAREPDRRAAGREDRVARRRARPRRPRRRRRRPARAGTSRVPASSRWIANSRTRTRIATVGGAGQPRHEAMSRPSPTGRIVALKRGSARTAVSNARRAAVFASSAATGRAPDDPAAPQDVVGDDERARARAGRRAPPGSASYSGLSASMKARSNGPASAGSPAANASSAGALTTVIRSSAMPGLAPPAAREVGPLAVRIDGHDRPVGGLAERQPQRRVAVRRPDLDDPPPAAGEDRQDPARCRGRRSGCRAARRRPRSPPARPGSGGASDSIQSRSTRVGDPASDRLFAHLGPHTSSPAPK